MARRRLRCLGLEPPDGSLADVAKLVHTPDTRPCDITGTQLEGFAVDPRFDPTIEDEICLLEWVVMGTDEATDVLETFRSMRGG